MKIQELVLFSVGLMIFFFFASYAWPLYRCVFLQLMGTATGILIGLGFVK